MAWEETRGRRSLRIIDSQLWILASLAKQLEYERVGLAIDAVAMAEEAMADSRWVKEYEARQW